VRTTAARVLALLSALTCLVFPGFGLADLYASWDPDWPVVLEASWGAFMTVLVGGEFLAIAVRPTRAAPATVTLLVDADRGRRRTRTAPWAGFGPVWSWLCIAWGLALAGPGLAAPLLQPREPGREVAGAR
jgi:hypothetical protein